MESRIRDLRRLALAHTPITDFGSKTSLGCFRLRVTSEIGTCNTMLCTLNDWTELTPIAAAEGIRCRFWNGRNAPRSKMLPRSTWKLSARCPANTFRPRPRLCTAAAVKVAS